MSRINNSMRAPLRKQEQGMILIVALVVLLAMTLAGALMLRNVGVGLGIAGNVAFKTESTSQADKGVEAGVTWVAAHTGVQLETSDSTASYSAVWDTGLDILAPATWAAAATAPAENGYSIQYVIHRLCKVEGPVTAAGQMCSYPLSLVTTSPSGSGSGITSGGKQPFYRVTAKVTGPRNTVSFVQVVFY